MDGIGKGLVNYLKLIMIPSQNGGTDIWVTGTVAYSNLYKL